MSTSYAVRRIGSCVALPPAGNDEDDLEHVASWDDSDNAEKTLERFIAISTGGRELDEHLPVEVRLVHRPDNDYNRNAISVLMPESFGGDVRARHMGFLRDSFLKKVGMGRLADLSAEYGEIVCTGMIGYGPHLALDLPDGPVLGRAIGEFLGELTEALRRFGDARRVVAPPSLRSHTSDSKDTTQALSHLRAFANPQQPVGRLQICTESGWASPRSLRLEDAGSGRFLGIVLTGYLFLQDERDRPDVLARLAGTDIPVVPPVTDPLLVGDDQWSLTSVPNMWTQRKPEALEFRARNPESPHSQVSLALYNPTSRKLWVEDSRLAMPACLHAARLGVIVDEVGLPRVPWNLEDEVPFRELRDPSLRGRRRMDVSLDVALMKPKRRLVPVDLFPAKRVKWVSTPLPERHEPESADVFLRHERYGRDRGPPFGHHQLSSTPDACRLCGRSALQFTADVSREPLAYCQECLRNAASGVSVPERERGPREREAAASALRLLGQYEFGGVPMLEPQLDTLHIDPTAPLTADEIDRLLLLRFAVPRRQYPWTYLLEEAGFHEDGLRTSRGTLIRARDGHRCLSMAEKTVCDFLHQHGISHEREPHYPVDPDFNVNGLRRADWQLDDGTLVEFWGLPDQPDYAAKMQDKRQLAAKHGLALVELGTRDLTRLHEAFEPWLSESSRDSFGWRWSPVREPEVRRVRATSRPDGAEFNDRQKADRRQRCSDTVRLQQQGLSRDDIAFKLGVSTGSVKELLRDGRFYLNPASDIERLELSRTALQAKRRGLTRDQFGSENALSNKKAIEAWRDAEITGDSQ